MTDQNAPPIGMTLRYRLAVAGFALIGLTGAVPVSIAEWRTGAGCPHLGALPACYIVALAYLAMLISVARATPWRPAVFFGGWLPVFVLAAVGTGLQLAGHDTCPKTADGWPKCYFSLALACAIIVPVIRHWLTANHQAAP